MLVIRERAAHLNERTLISTDDVDVSHPEGDAHIDEQRVTLCADQLRNVISSWTRSFDSNTAWCGRRFLRRQTPCDSISSPRRAMETPDIRHSGGDGLSFRCQMAPGSLAYKQTDERRTIQYGPFILKGTPVKTMHR